MGCSSSKAKGSLPPGASPASGPYQSTTDELFKQLEKQYEASLRDSMTSQQSHLSNSSKNSQASLMKNDTSVTRVSEISKPSLSTVPSARPSQGYTVPLLHASQSIAKQAQLPQLQSINTSVNMKTNANPIQAIEAIKVEHIHMSSKSVEPIIKPAPAYSNINIQHNVRVPTHPQLTHPVAKEIVNDNSKATNKALKPKESMGCEGLEMETPTAVSRLSEFLNSLPSPIAQYAPPVNTNAQNSSIEAIKLNPEKTTYVQDEKPSRPPRIVSVPVSQVQNCQDSSQEDVNEDEDEETENMASSFNVSKLKHVDEKPERRIIDEPDTSATVKTSTVNLNEVKNNLKSINKKKKKRDPNKQRAKVGFALDQNKEIQIEAPKVRMAETVKPDGSEPIPGQQDFFEEFLQDGMFSNDEEDDSPTRGRRDQTEVRKMISKRKSMAAVKIGRVQALAAKYETSSITRT